MYLLEFSLQYIVYVCSLCLHSGFASAAPVVFVDYHRSNLITDSDNPSYSEFYYVFLRENLHTDVDESVSFDVRSLDFNC